MSVFEYGKNEVIINLNEYCPSFEEVKKIIKNNKNYYNTSLNKIKDDLLLDYSLENFDTIVDAKLKQKRIVKQVINNVINEFPILKQRKVYIFLFGSFATNMNRYDSDIDLSMIYSDEDYNDLLPVEELIDYVLSQIFGLYRDQIHTMMHYTVDNTIKCFSYFDNINFKLKWDDNDFLVYNCRPHRESLLYKVHKCNRSIKTLKRHLNDNINENKCEEWVIKFDTIYTNMDFDINNYIHQLEKNIPLNTNNIKKFIEQTALKVSNIKNKKIIKIETIGYFKKYFKDDITKLVNTTFNIARRLKLKDNQSIELLDYTIYLYYFSNFSVFDKNSIQKLNKQLLSYIQAISQISHAFNLHNIPFSHHNETSLENALLITKIDIQQIQDLYKKRNTVLNTILKLLEIIKGQIDE